jgi:hypothetical protein
MSTLIVKNLDAPTGESIVAPDLQLPQGSVVNVYRYEYEITAANGGSQTLNTTSFTDFRGLSAVTYTPQKAGNKLFIDFRIPMRAYAHPSHGDIGYYVRGLVDGAEVIQFQFIGDNLGKLGDSIWLPQQMNFTAEYTTTSNSAVTISAQGRAGVNATYNQIQVPHFSDNRHRHQVIVTEVAV